MNKLLKSKICGYYILFTRLTNVLKRIEKSNRAPPVYKPHINSNHTVS